MARTFLGKCCAAPVFGDAIRWWHARASTSRNLRRGWVPVPFVILGQPRCGTNALAVFLDGQPGVVCHREIIDGIDAFSDKESVERPETKPEAHYWDWLYRARPECRAVGWKYLNVQNAAFLDAMLRDGFVRKLVLLRRNKFRQVLSNRLAMHHQQWRAKSGEQLQAWKARREPIHIDTRGFLNEITYYVKEELRIRNLLSSRPAPFFEVWYEDCFGRQAHTVRAQILRFLQLPADMSPKETGDLQMNPEPWRELVANADEIERAMADTPYRWMLK